MKKMKLDLEGLSLEELRAYQEVFVSTISNLKQGLFNAQAAMGLHNSLALLSDFHLQTSSHIRDTQEKVENFRINNDVHVDVESPNEAE